MQANGGSGEVPFRPTLMVVEQGEHNSLDHNAGQFNCKHYLSENLTFEGRLPLLLEFTIIGAPLVCHSSSSILLTLCCADSPAGKNIKKQRLASIVILV
jgi:hypothetical protein